MSYRGYKNKESYALSKKKDYEKHKPHIQEYHRQYYLDHREETIAKATNRYDLKRISINDSVTRYRRRLKIEVLTYYGNGRCACVRCGFNDVRALSIDHITGGGNHHRRKIEIKAGSDMYVWLKKNNYPDGFQTLCMNCQFIKKDESHEYHNYLKEREG